MTTSTNLASTIKQLETARNLCLADPNKLYAQIIPGLAPIINADAELELRRWGADFLSEAFASPVLAPDQKQSLAVKVLDVLKGYIDKPEQDALVIKSVVQTASSIYQFVVRHIIANQNDTEAWQKMTAIKSNILRRMDTAPAGVRLCCIKFIQRVVQAQTPGMIADPRRPDLNETSLALVPRNHPIIPYSNLEAEASGLLDRLLSVIQDNSSDALIVTATLNSLASLVRGRASIANKIVSTVAAFNPFTLAQVQSPISIKNKILIRSMTRTTISFLTNIVKRNPQHSLAGRIQGTLDRLRQSLAEVFDESKRKRAAPDEPIDGLSDAKRARLDAVVELPAINGAQIPPFPSEGPVTYAQLFTLTADKGVRDFHVKALPLEIVCKILGPLLASIEPSKFNEALNIVRSRHLKLEQNAKTNALAAAKIAVGETGDEDDDYEPDFMPAAFQHPEVTLGPFYLPPPPPLTNDSALAMSKNAVLRIFATLEDLDKQAVTKVVQKGFSRPAASNHDRNGWITLLVRLASRTSSGLGFDPNGASWNFPDAIRQSFVEYIKGDFRRRIDLGIIWLNEEWYNDRLVTEKPPSAASMTNGTAHRTTKSNQYTKWLYTVLDVILLFIDAKDRVLIRFLSEIPAMDSTVVSRVVKLAGDPDRVNLAIQALHYLILYRPPVKEICLDGVEDLWRNYDDAKIPAQKLLVKFRPAVLGDSLANGNAAIKQEA